MRIALTMAALLATAACATTTPAGQDAAAPAQPAPDDPTLGACDAARVQRHVGRPYQDAMGAQLQQEAGARSVRVLRPGDAATMDYRNDRLNIDLDAQNRIAAVRCG